MQRVSLAISFTLFLTSTSAFAAPPVARQQVASRPAGVQPAAKAPVLQRVAPTARPTPAPRNVPQRAKKHEGVQPPSPRRAAPTPKTPSAQGSPLSKREKPAVPTSPTAKTPAADTPSTALSLPYVPDRSVQIFKLDNGVVCWCKSNKPSRIVHVWTGIAAGSGNDAKGLFGTSRFLASLLDVQLNQPKNPPHSTLPPGENLYIVKLRKDWVTVKTQVDAARLTEALRHLSKTLQKPPPELIPETLREQLMHTTAQFPPPGLLERIDSYLFPGQPRGAYLRGNRNTFKQVQPVRLQMSHRELYRPHRMRLLVVGAVDCGAFEALLRETFGTIPKGEEKANKTPILPTEPAQPSGRLFLGRELVHIFQLPLLQREDYAPLYLLHKIAKAELQRTLTQKFGSPFPIHTALQPYADHGYILFVLPTRPTQYIPLQQILKKTLGDLRMTPYPPTLKQRLQTIRHTLRMELRAHMESSEFLAQLLFSQMVLPSKTHKHPQNALALLDQWTPELVRFLARRYMDQSTPVAPGEKPFSPLRIILFIGTLLLVWVLLDQTFRRARRNDD